MQELTLRKNFSSARVLIVGDIMLDRYMFGSVSRISPEAPVPIVKINRTEERPGGAANVALNIAVLGGKAILLGIVGSDQPGRLLKQKLAAAGVKPLLIEEESESTIIKLRILSQNQQLIRLDFEDEGLFTKYEALLEEYKQNLQSCDLVVMTDYNKGTLKNLHQAIITLASDAGKMVLVDPKSADFSRYSGAYLLTPNQQELERVVGKCENEEELLNKGRQLLQDFNIRSLLVTRGEKGMTLISVDNTVLHVPARAKEVFDVTGAGDTVMATLAATLASGMHVEDSVKLANIAAGIVVSKIGTSSVTISELLAEIQTRDHLDSGVVTLEQLLSLIQNARENCEKIVFTNGCFDILHVGHINYLQEARKLGDRLIVAVNDDKSVERLKGIGRPINTLEKRMKMLAALKFVDWVVPFSEDTPEDLICTIIPDLLVKGGDYRPEEIAGYDCVIRAGGKVLVLDYTEEESTTNIINTITQKSNN